MTDTTKGLIGALAAMATLVACFGLMADCAKVVSRTGSDAVASCIRDGGKWIGNNDGIQPAGDTCIMPEKK